MATWKDILKMFKKIKKACQKNKYLLIKNAVTLKSFGLDFSFDDMFSIFGKHNNLAFENKTTPFLNQIIKLNELFIFKTYLDFVNTNLKDIFTIGNLDSFYSIRGEVGPTHEDSEHVLILGIKNTTYYHIDNIDLQINPGDVLYIPKGYYHHAFSSRERIILSLSLWKK